MDISYRRDLMVKSKHKMCLVLILAMTTPYFIRTLLSGNSTQLS